MNCKKILSTVMAGAIAMSLAVPAFAQETVVTATYKEPTIAVSVPSTAIATINPYKLPVKFQYDSKGQLATDQTKTPSGGAAIQSKDSAIASQPMLMFNLGDSALEVSATIGLELPEETELKFVADKAGFAADAETPLTNKSIYMVVEGAAAGSGAAAVMGDTEKPNELEADKLKAVWEAVTWTGAKASAPASTKTAAAQTIGTLKQATIAPTDGAITMTDPCVLAIRLNGEAVQSPKSAWAATDTFKATIAYTFKVVADIT